ncbi:hypothetical protein VMCG_05309 [Cytospora schulzeri]|uniref:Uncharacterized protein n=1 Tax=Cytospora schulzeri TaxID=448051 RepID=A0A423WQZ0_9PEZI|nr:hypothetical protein VMCG_05309 [Valsa malicola]
MANNINAPILLNDRPGNANNVRTGHPGRLGGRYPTPPGVTDDYWGRLLNIGDSHVQNHMVNGPQNFTPGQLDTLKFRKAYRRLLVDLAGATPQGTTKQQALHTTRAHLPPEFFAWVMLFGYVIDTTT